MTKAISEDLQTLYELLKAVQPRAGKVETFDRLARRLSAIADRKPAWTWRYVQGVAAGTIAPSKDLAHAVALLAAAVDGEPPEFAEAVEMQILADPAKVQAGSLVLGQSRQCKHPPCKVMFVPSVPWGKYCPAHRDPKTRK